MQIERERFEAWLFSQPPEKSFVFTNPRECVVCHFVRETTNKIATALPRSFSLWSNGPYKGAIETNPLPEWLINVLTARTYDSAEGKSTCLLYVRDMQKRYLELFPDTHLSDFAPQNGANGPTPASVGNRTDGPVNSAVPQPCDKRIQT